MPGIQSDRDGGATLGRAARIDAGERVGLTSGDREEVPRLRQENRGLHADVDLLERAMALFAKGTGEA